MRGFWTQFTMTKCISYGILVDQLVRIFVPDFTRMTLGARRRELLAAPALHTVSRRNSTPLHDKKNQLWASETSVLVISLPTIIQYNCIYNQ